MYSGWPKVSHNVALSDMRHVYTLLRQQQNSVFTLFFDPILSMVIKFTYQWLRYVINYVIKYDILRRTQSLLCLVLGRS